MSYLHLITTKPCSIQFQLVGGAGYTRHPHPIPIPSYASQLLSLSCNASLSTVLSRSAPHVPRGSSYYRFCPPEHARSRTSGLALLLPRRGPALSQSRNEPGPQAGGRASLTTSCHWSISELSAFGRDGLVHSLTVLAISYAARL